MLIEAEAAYITPEMKAYRGSVYFLCQLWAVPYRKLLLAAPNRGT